MMSNIEVFGNDLDFTALTKEQLQQFIFDIEEKLKTCDNQIDVPVNHYFSKDVYAREMNVPKGVFLTGKIHKFENLNILTKGEVSVLSIDGCMRVKAPYTFVASAGAKRLFYMHEDTQWTTIHGTSEKDPEKIEKIFTTNDIGEIDFKNETKLIDEV